MSTVPLVVWDAHLICDGCGDEVRVTTDGVRLFAAAPWGDDTEAERELSTLTFVCPNMIVKRDEPCAGLITVDLGTEHWTADVKLRTLVAEHGTEVTVR